MPSTDLPTRSTPDPQRSYANQPDASAIQDFFDSIAKRYDFLNQFLSFRLDEVWRKKSVDRILNGTETRILDLGIGTGKYLSLFLKKQPWKRAAGVDFSEEMLLEAKAQLPAEVELIQADFHQLPFEKRSFDLIISSFTLRSVQNMEGFLCELLRVLSDEGKVAFLCLTRPRSRLWKVLYYPYLKLYLPFLGGLISGNRKAYQFLSNSIQSFQDPALTKILMQKLGFSRTESFPYHFGMATLIIGYK